MNHKQKLGYTLLGAGLLALGIIIGQFITPDIEAQSNGVFDKITCRTLEVVDKNGNIGREALVIDGLGLFGNIRTKKDIWQLCLLGKHLKMRK